MANEWGNEGESQERYYPPAISRNEPEWLWELRFLFGDEETQLGELLHEIYEALQGQQFRLALMGVRAFFEKLMIAKVGDFGTFSRNLDEFVASGYIAPVQRTAIESILESGHAAVHRAYKPIARDLKIALDILESVVEANYFHELNAKQVAARVPPRAPRKKV